MISWHTTATNSLILKPVAVLACTCCSLHTAGWALFATHNNSSEQAHRWHTWSAGTGMKTSRSKVCQLLNLIFWCWDREGKKGQEKKVNEKTASADANSSLVFYSPPLVWGNYGKTTHVLQNQTCKNSMRRDVPQAGNIMQHSVCKNILQTLN